MRWARIATVLCMAWACVGTAMAEQALGYRLAPDRSMERVGAPGMAAGAAFAVSKEAQPSEVSIDRSPDGSCIRVDRRRLEAAAPGEGDEPAAPRGGGCGDPESGSCCEANGTPYCDDANCCALICYVLGFSWCCDEGGGGWDDMCTAAAQDICGDVCGPPTAACCFGDQCTEMEEAACLLEGGRWYRGNHCSDFQCPGCSAEGTLFSQTVSNWSSYFGTTCDHDSGYSLSFDNFSGVQGDICGVKWYGTPEPAEGWECDENPMTFIIEIRADEGGMPGTVVCTYTETVTGEWIGPYNWVEYEVIFDTCCTLESGWISIQGTGGPDCFFGWISAEEGEGDTKRCSWSPSTQQWNCVEPGDPWAFDLNLCLLGTLHPGACCDEVAGTCQDGVEAADCPPTSRFSPAVLCADMDPPCGTLAGACCIDEPPYCSIEAGVNCEGFYLGDGTTCDPNDCNTNGIPDTCDIVSGNSADCDGNGIPDDCDIAGGADDFDANGVLDACEPDCNDNGLVDACDIDCATGDCDSHPTVTCGSSLDCQPNGVPDDCELGTLGSPTLWDNGAPNDTYALRSHFGGSYEDALTVDDFNLPSGGVINGLHWEVEETDDFQWQGFVRVFLFGDNGNGGPDDGDELAVFMVPTDTGAVVKTWLGDGAILANRYRYDIYGLDIPLGPGIWWIGLAPDGGDFDFFGGAASRWCASHSGGDVVAGEAHYRAPGAGYTFFEPWSAQGAPGPHDAAFTVTTTVIGADCNGNGIPDDCDIAECDGSASCQDCQGNGMPDGCEPDCNANGVADQCDILFCDGSAWCSDCDGNEIPDECQVPPLGTGPDCNGNAVPDECDIASGASPDCNENGIPDECDMAGGTSDDYDLNGVPDECDPDCNENSVPDVCDVDCAAGNCIGHPLGCEGSLDCQPDGIPDDCQLGVGATYLTDDGTQEQSYGLTLGGTLGWMNTFTVDGGYGTITAISLAWGAVPNGLPCTVYLWSDPNGDGSPADGQVLAFAETVVVNADTDTLTTVDIPDTYVGPADTPFFVGALMDHQADEHPAAMDYDGEGLGWITGDTSFSLDPNDLDGGSAALEPFAPSWLIRAEGMATNDCNQNGVPDECDVVSGFSGDCDSNGVPDECEWLDCNSNGVFDVCDVLTCDGSPWCSDCNANGIPDQCDVPPLGDREDCQPNGIPDECEEDCNANGNPDDCDLRDCDGSIWCDDCNENDIVDECDAGYPGGAVYQHDDGSAEGSLGVEDPAEIAWIQRFVVVPGSETIVAIATCFGSTGAEPGDSGVNPGDQFRVFVWDDPDGDGHPSDAVLLGSATAYANAGSIDSDVLQEVPIGPVTVSGSFFIGAAVVSEMFPAPWDANGVLAHESWIVAGWLDDDDDDDDEEEKREGGFDPHDFDADNLDDIEYPGNWLLRALSKVGPAFNDCNGNGIPDDCEWCGDLDGDDDADYDDYVIFLEAFGGVTDGAPPEDWCCDFDDSGAVGMADYAAWLDCYRDFVGDPLAGPPSGGLRPPAPTVVEPVQRALEPQPLLESDTRRSGRELNP